MKLLFWQLAIASTLVLLAAALWPRFIATHPSTWNAAHVGMQRTAIHTAAGAPTGGDYDEKRMERWACDSPLVYRTMMVWYSDSARPTTATEVSVVSHWHFGIEFLERLEQSAIK